MGQTIVHRPPVGSSVCANAPSPFPPQVEDFPMLKVGGRAGKEEEEEQERERVNVYFHFVELVLGKETEFLLERGVFTNDLEFIYWGKNKACLENRFPCIIHSLDALWVPSEHCPGWY
jgi:hypothetical protein